MMHLEGDVLFLTGDLDLNNLMAFRHEIEVQVTSSSNITVDLTDLTVHGSAILSLLVFLKRRAIADTGSVQIRGCSEVVRQMARVAELEELLGLTA